MSTLSTRFSTSANLNSKDDRKKRRAVRELFELDDESNLSSFIPLLDDKDSWYRTKALDAFRMWSIRLDTSQLSPLINHHNLDYNRAAANLLERFEKNNIETVKRLFEKDDLICQIKSAEFILQCDNQENFFEDLLQNKNARLKLIALNSKYSTQKILIESLEDKSSSVVNFCLGKLVELDFIIEDDKLSQLISQGVNFTNFAPYLIKHNPQKLIDQIENLNSIEIRMIVKMLRQECETLDHEIIKMIIQSKSYVVLGRWLQGKKGDVIDKLRWEIIADENVDEIERCRFVERLFSRCDEDNIINMAKIISEESDSDLIKITAHNLSTAYAEGSP